MSINTINKRLNVMGMDLPSLNIGLKPSGTIDAEDRRNYLGLYIGYNSVIDNTPVQYRLGKTMVIPGGSFDGRFKYVEPLKAKGGSLAAAAATDDQLLTDLAGAGLHSYITDIDLIATAVGSGASTVELLDAEGGNILWSLKLLAAPAVNQSFRKVFEIPPRCASANGQFVITTRGSGFTWNISCNGYIDSILGNTSIN